MVGTAISDFKKDKSSRMKSKDSIIVGVRQFAKDVSQYKIIKKILLPFWIPVRWLLDRMSEDKNQELNDAFRRNGLETLKDFTEVLDSIEVNYTLAFGTMLGAIREHGFIKHDLDIDLMIWISDYTEMIPQKLKEYGFSLKKSYSVDDKRTGYEETYQRNGIGIDIFYLYAQDKGLPYCCDFLTFPDSASIENSIKKHGGLMPRKLELPYTKERVKVKFENLELYVPKNAHEILRFRYGEDYMIPNANWSIRSFDNHISIMDGKIGIYTLF